MVKARKIVMTRAFKGEPKLTDFRTETEELPPLKDGEVLCEAKFLSVDPFQRGYIDIHKIGDTMRGQQLSRIVESRNPQYPAGSYVVSYWGWRDYTVSALAPGESAPLPDPVVVPDLGGLPQSLSLGVLGMPGASAYLGLTEVCDPQPGETVVVSGAAGAVGTIVGQVAKIIGCRVIGFTGSDAKAKWLREELGFDYAFNYRTVDLDKALKEAAPKGVDVYYDNVGGVQSSRVIQNMSFRGRIVVLGCISAYNETQEPMAPVVQRHFVEREIMMRGFAARSCVDRWHISSTQLGQWIREGKLKYRETITEGFEKAPEAFIGMLRGENIGKAIVKV